MYWTEWQEQDLDKCFHNTDIDILAERYNRKPDAVRNKYRHMKGYKPVKRKPQVELSGCPNCKKEINRVEMGYFCKYCLKEYDNYGYLIAPLL